MFGLKNFSGWTFVGKIGNTTIAFASGVVEELALNMTLSSPANAAEITQGLVPSKDQIIKVASVSVSSKILRTDVFSLIYGATPNIFI